MKRVLFIYFAIVMVVFGLISCNDVPNDAERDVTFPMKIEFLNKNDSTVYGGFDIRLFAYLPDQDSSYYQWGGLGAPSVGYHFEMTADKDGYPGVKLGAVISAMKMWPDQEDSFQTKKWFCIEVRKVFTAKQATLHFTWPEDTSRFDVHEFGPDTVTNDNFPCF